MNEARIAAVREKLNSEKVKLWLPPYTVDSSSEGIFPADFVERYARELDISAPEIISILSDLRRNALERIAEKQRFQESGEATFRVKVAQRNAQSNGSHTNTTVQCKLSENGKALKTAVAAKIDAPDAGRLKLITAGRVVDDLLPLEQQGIKHNHQILVLVLSETAASALASEQRAVELTRIKQDAALVSSANEDGPGSADSSADLLVQIADQSGKPLPIPKEERKALSMAMILHEKGRSAIKRKEYEQALVLLLESDVEFKNCTSDLLNKVDNYALLCLDITWCYLLLRSVSHFTDAEKRLFQCEQLLKRSYGENLERVVVLKGGAEKEHALFVRLYLLQGIVAFHKGQLDLCRQLLNKVKINIDRLKVDDKSLATLCSMGYSPSEARLGLRAAQGSLDGAVNEIHRKREDRQKRMEEEAAKRKRLRRAKLLGTTDNGQQWINVEYYDSLVQMGFNPLKARRALAATNNDMAAAIEYIQMSNAVPPNSTSPDQARLGISADGSQPSTSGGASSNNGEFSETRLAEMMSLGFDLERCIAALSRFNGDMERALEWLFANRGKQDQSSDDESERAREQMEALHRLRKDIARDEEDHLDVTLCEEEELWREYTSLLESAALSQPSHSEPASGSTSC